MAKKKKGTPANQSARYTKFITERDKALEVILNNYRAMFHDCLRGAFQTVKEKIAFRMSTAPKQSMLTDGSQFLDAVDKDIKAEFQKTINIVAGLFVKLKLSSYTLSYTGECEAIAQAKDKRGKVNLTQDDAVEQAVSNARGENIAGRITLAFDRLRRKILDAVQLSRVAEDSIADTLERVDRALPGGQWVVRPKRMLKSVKEADPKKYPPGVGTMIEQPAPVDLAMGFIDQELWDNVVTDYLRKFVPTYQFRAPHPDADYAYTRFELEQEMNNEFLASVRTGQDKAARDNGIKEFMWISIIDGATDECCIWRDSLTTSEIEQALNGPHADDECDAIIPPAHFNCRCTIAPILDTIPESPFELSKEFDEWLNS